MRVPQEIGDRLRHEAERFAAAARSVSQRSPACGRTADLLFGLVISFALVVLVQLATLFFVLTVAL